MRIRNLKNSQELLDNCLYLIKDPKNYKGKFNNLFNNDNPIHIEIGMGKGRFIYETALQNPNINFIGIEKHSNVIVRAIKLIGKECPSNLFLIREDASELSKIFAKEVSTIYLNFSDPWPKKRYHKRRLTSKRFLTIYDEIFKSQKKIIMKTDNDDFFEYSIDSLKDFGYKIKMKTNDLESSNISNIKTEYEMKFTKMGIKINYLMAIKK